MYRLLILILICPLFTHAQSLPDTLSYLQDRMSALEGIETTEFKTCTIVWRDKLTVGGRVVSDFRKTLPLGDVDTVTHSGLFLFVKTISDTVKVEPLRDQPMIQKGTYIPVSDKEIAGKLTKAFLRARDLCREKKDLF